jgi:hypothetical protein
MSDRLREAVAALDGVRAERAQRAPSLLDRESWEAPTSLADEDKAAALEVVRQAAVTRATFTVADLAWPPVYDARSRGAALRTAARNGWISAAGYVTSGADRHGRPIVRWVSRLHATSGRPPTPAVNNPAEGTCDVDQ